MNDEIRTAIITDATITKDEDYGVLTIWLLLDYGDSREKFGGHILYIPGGLPLRAVYSPAGHFIWRVMEIAGALRWDQVKGQAIRVKASHNEIHAIGHVVNNDWFDPAVDFGSDDDCL